MGQTIINLFSGVDEYKGVILTALLTQGAAFLSACCTLFWCLLWGGLTCFAYLVFRSLHLHTDIIICNFPAFQMKEAIMNQEKLAKLQAQVRIGGKVMHAKWIWHYMKMGRFFIAKHFLSVNLLLSFFPFKCESRDMKPELKQLNFL